MNKPTVFFSHSSKDREMILKLKDKLSAYTGNTLHVFMSSDGQSIPFGTNWIHKVEDGLKTATIMFVFVTENSISSGWIYFEAGFAYSKGIQVIPVGIGMDIGALKAPLNMLQGFNISSPDSLNNFVSIVNNAFSYSFTESFTDSDYEEIIASYALSDSKKISFDQLIQSVKFELSGEYHDSDSNTKIYRENDALFRRIKEFLDRESISYAFSDPYSFNFNGVGDKCISVLGLRIICRNEFEMIEDKMADKSKINVSISIYNFEKSFALYLQLISLCKDKTLSFIDLRLKPGFSFVTAIEDCAAILGEAPEWFALVNQSVGAFESVQLSLRFRVFDYRHDSRNPDYVLRIFYNPISTDANNIRKLISKLYELNLIHNDSRSLKNG